MNPELTYRLEVARVLEARILEVEAVQECVSEDLAFHRSLKFWRDQIIGGLQLSVHELAPSDGEEVGRSIRSLEYGEVPVARNDESGIPNVEAAIQKQSGSQESKNGHKPISRAGSIGPMRRSTGADSSVQLRARAVPKKKLKSETLKAEIEAVVPESVDEFLARKSPEIMEQWRV